MKDRLRYILLFFIMFQLSGLFLRNSSTGAVSTAKRTAGIPVPNRLFPGDEGKCSAKELKTSSIEKTRVALSYQFKGLKVVEFGVCYSSAGSPAISSQKVTDYQDEPRDVPDYISMKTTIRGLTKDTEYFVRVYVINSSGDICYSDELKFSTPKEIDYSAMLNGPKTEYYPNGKVMKKYKLKDGKVDGLYQFYGDSGNLVSEQQLKEGIPEGLMTSYYPNGNKQYVSNFKDGLPQGESKSYYPDGTLKSESMCSGELLKQSCQNKTYYPDGALQSESQTSNGEFASSISYDRQGRVTFEQRPGSSVSNSYDNDGWKHTSINGEKCQCSRCNSN